MTGIQKTIGAGALLSAALLLVSVPLNGQGTVEVFTATAAVKTAAGGSATAPVTITIDRKMPQREADTSHGNHSTWLEQPHADARHDRAYDRRRPAADDPHGPGAVLRRRRPAWRQTAGGL